MNFKLFTTSAAAIALLASGAIAQDRPATTPANPPAAMDGTVTKTQKTTTMTTTEAIQFSASANADQMAVSELTGTDVRNSAGETLGDLSDVIIDDEGKPAIAIVGVGGFLGLGEKNVGVPFGALQFSMDGNERVARLDTTKEALEAAPNFVYAEKNTAGTPAARTQ